MDCIPVMYALASWPASVHRLKMKSTYNYYLEDFHRFYRVQLGPVLLFVTVTYEATFASNFFKSSPQIFACFLACLFAYLFIYIIYTFNSPGKPHWPFYCR